MVGGERGQSPFKIGAKGRGGVTRKAGPAQSLPTWRLPKGRQMEPVTRRTRETCSGRAWGPGKLAWRAASPSLLMTVLPPAAAQIGTSGRGAFLRGAHLRQARRCGSTGCQTCHHAPSSLIPIFMQTN